MQINMPRVWFGGLVAGLTVMVSGAALVPMVGNDMDMALARLGLPPLSPAAMAYFVLVSFIVGIVLVWLYAAFIPRLGARITTALTAAAIVWLIGYLLPNVAKVFYGFLPVKLTLIGTAWGLIELAAGSLIGSRLYKERRT